MIESKELKLTTVLVIRQTNVSFLFNIILCDLLLFLPNIDIASYTDDKILYIMNKAFNVVVQDIKIAWVAFYLVSKNSILANPDKFHLLLTNTDCQGIEVCNEKTENSFCEKLL